MDDFDLMEPLSYGGDEEEEADIIKSGRKRSGSVDGETPTGKTSKRQRVKSPDLFQIDSDKDEDDVFPVEEVQPAPNKSSAPEVTSTGTKRNGGVPTGSVDSSRTTEDEPFVAFRRVLKRIPHEIPYLPVTCEDGSRLYLRLKEKIKETDTEGDEKLMCSKEKGCLFDNWEDIKQEARRLKDKFHTELAKTVNNGAIGGNNVKAEDQQEQMPDCLWVEKYKPRAFLDLLSQEAVNTALLHWIKLWDKSVFGVDYLAKIKANREKYAKLEAAEKEINERFHKKSYLPQNEDYDDTGRPVLNVALLGGDPGLGKTTCAHIVARHAGYNVREVNASDDRSIEAFRKMLDDTTQSRSEIFTEGRPNCLIIDEIDGAPAPSVNVLVELMLGNATEKGKKKNKKILRRPVICICNDLYSPSLKILKKHAFVIQFPSITVPRMAERLSYVIRKENLHLDSNTVQSLCQKSECDIRSCLSTLQFLKMKRYTSKDAIFAQIGNKDKSKSIFAVWGDIFTLPLEKRYQDAQPDPSKPDARFRNILTVVQNYGEYDKLVGGVFENYLKVKYRDSYLQSVVEGLEWTNWFEDIRTYVERTQTYGLYGYLPMYFTMSHFLYARKDLIKLQFPSLELISKVPKIQQTLRSQISETAASSARFMDPHMLITDIFPAVINIIQPSNIRPVPTQIWTQRERDTLTNVVQIMLTYNLTYTQTKNPETGAYFFQLEPDLDDMVRYKLQDAAVSKKPFPYAIKQLVSREIETEKLRRNDVGPEIVQREVFKQPGTPKPSAKSKALEAFNKTPIAVARDFFGRPIIPSADISPETETKKKASTAVYFQFKEGYSNAVRRYVKMRDLL